MGRIRLTDGRTIAVRPIAPEDERLIDEVFAGLGERSRYQRFLGAVERLTPSMLRYLTAVDHHDHEALIATDAATGRPVGTARFIRDRTDATTAEFAVTVVDAWQRSGVGTALFALLADRAREEGVAVLEGEVLAQNAMIHHLAHEFGPVEQRRLSSGVERLAVRVPQRPLAPEIPRLLIQAASFRR